MVLCGAMLAPALLAGGLLVAELTGYETAARMADAGAKPETPGKRGKSQENEGRRIGADGDVGSRLRADGDMRSRPGTDGDVVSRLGIDGGAGARLGADSDAGARLEADGGVMSPIGTGGVVAQVGGGVGALIEQEGAGLDEGEMVAVVPVAVGAVRSGMFEPRLLPPPLRPERVYGGWVPVAARSEVGHEAGELSEPGILGESRPDASGESQPEISGESQPDAVVPLRVRRGPREPREVALRPSATTEPQEGRTEPWEGCPVEWRGTWLWEVCREHVRQEV